MAIEKVSKVLVAVHRESRDRFLARLQRMGVMHITGTEDAATDQRLPTAESRRVIEAIELLSAKQKKGRAARGRPVLTREEFETTASGYDYQSHLDRFAEIAREQVELDNRAKAIETEVRRLRPWQRLRHDPQKLYAGRVVTVTLVRFADRAGFVTAVEAMRDLPAAFEEVDVHENEVLALLAVQQGAAQAAAGALSSVRFETVDLRGVRGRPSDVLRQFDAELVEVKSRQESLGREVEDLTSELPRLKVAADALAAEEARRATGAALEHTSSVSLVYGWVRTRDLSRLGRLIADTGVAVMVEVAPAEGEEPPVALVNRPIFRPFEIVVDLFSLPSPRELDPTWLIAPFFGTFFALCLTDAGYGVVTAVVTYLLMRRMGMNNKLLGVVLIGAILTIPAGALVGGWFGDVPDRLGLAGVQAFKNHLMWFDPVKDPMKFFMISVALGYVQMISGIVFEIVDCLRVRNYGDGLLVQLPWFVLLNGLTARMLLARYLPPWGSAVLMVLILAAVAAIVIFTQRSRQTGLSQTFWFLLLGSFFVFLGSRWHWLPVGFGLAKWAFFAVFMLMYVYAAMSLVRGKKLRPIPVILGIAGLAALAGYSAHLVPAWLACGLGTVFLFLSPSNAALLQKFLWGGYALYGATGYIGVVLSYIRLMALGMCTGGVAVAINVIAWMVMPMPVVGVLLATIVLVVGHSYNIAVNVLGAFVHSLRLQYVEFFPRFYAGGGEPFVPFRENNQFVTLK